MDTRRPAGSPGAGGEGQGRGASESDFIVVQLSKGAFFSTVALCLSGALVSASPSQPMCNLMAVSVLLAAPLGMLVPNTACRALAKCLLPGAIYENVKDRGVLSGASAGCWGRSGRFGSVDAGLCMAAVHDTLHTGRAV